MIETTLTQEQLDTLDNFRQAAREDLRRTPKDDAGLSGWRERWPALATESSPNSEDGLGLKSSVDGWQLFGEYGSFEPGHPPKDSCMLDLYHKIPEEFRQEVIP